jgi:NAD(P)H-hydrate repair Nnr-like enzyme with NAD(P)H-hydrate dehydratase domain
MNIFDKTELKNLWKPQENSNGEDNGQITIIGGSKLFHGAPILSLKVASRIVDMVFFASPEKSVGHIAEQIKSKLMSFIWVPWEEVDAYIEKSDAVLIGPGMMRFASEKRKVIRDKKNIDNENDLSHVSYRQSPDTEFDEAGKFTRDITKRLLLKFPKKKWVIDAGSLQTMDAEWIPEGAILTPNEKEFEMLFKVFLPGKDDRYYESDKEDLVTHIAHQYKCTIVLKGPETIVSSYEYTRWIKGGNAGLTKGGTGDVLAGLTVALYAKNDAHLSACAASYIEKAAADELYKKVGTNYNAGDLADHIPTTITTCV